MAMSILVFLIVSICYSLFICQSRSVTKDITDFHIYYVRLYYPHSAMPADINTQCRRPIMFSSGITVRHWQLHRYPTYIHRVTLLSWLLVALHHWLYKCTSWRVFVCVEAGRCWRIGTSMMRRELSRLEKELEETILLGEESDRKFEEVTYCTPSFLNAHDPSIDSNAQKTANLKWTTIICSV